MDYGTDFLEQRKKNKMRWKIKPDPKMGDERIIKRFLILPRIVKGECRWLESAQILQIMYPLEGEGSRLVWEDSMWVDNP